MHEHYSGDCHAAESVELWNVSNGRHAGAYAFPSMKACGAGLGMKQGATGFMGFRSARR
jgi:hypothetical protein